MLLAILAVGLTDNEFQIVESCKTCAWPIWCTGYI